MYIKLVKLSAVYIREYIRCVSSIKNIKLLHIYNK